MVEHSTVVHFDYHTKEFFAMIVSQKKQRFLTVALLVLIVGVALLFISPTQESVVSSDTTAQSPLPSRAPAGYTVPARPEVILPFTHVSADRLRLGNVREVGEGEPLPVLVSGSYSGIASNRRSPDGQWILSYVYSQDPLSIIKTDGSGERRTLLVDPEYLEERYASTNWKRIYEYDQVVWSWDSSRLFYQVQRGYKEESESSEEFWVESVDINTGDVTRHPDIGFYSNLHSYATARYPTDPVLFEDSTIYDRIGPRGIETNDGSARWVIDGFIPLYLSPNKQMVLGYDRYNVDKVLIYSIDGSTLLYSFDSGVSVHRLPSVYGLLSVHGYSWSPDSSKIAYTDGEYDDRNKLLFSELYIMNLDGTGKTQLTDTLNIAESFQGWTLDGQIVFHTSRSEEIGYHWYIADLIIE